MVASSDPAWLEGTFNALVGLFDRVGLWTNVGKTVIMVCHPCQATAGNITQAAYGRRLTGGVHTRSGSASGCNARSVGNSWRSVQCRVIWWIDIVKRRGEDANGHPRQRPGTRYTGCLFRLRGDHGDAPWRGARGNWQQGKQCGCTSCIIMSSTPWWCWRKETSPTHGAPGVTCRSPVRS